MTRHFLASLYEASSVVPLVGPSVTLSSNSAKNGYIGILDNGRGRKRDEESEIMKSF